MVDPRGQFLINNLTKFIYGGYKRAKKVATVNVKASGNTLDGAEFVNAATEETLIELLRAVLAMSKKSGGQSKEAKLASANLKRLSEESKNSSEEQKKYNEKLRKAKEELEKYTEELKKAKEEEEKLRETAEKLDEALDKASDGFNNIRNVLDGMVTVFGSVVASGITMGKFFFNSEITLSAFTSTLADAADQLPVFGGLLGGLIGIFSKFAAYLEETRDVMNQLGETGAAFNDDLMSMRSAAAATGMGLKEFAGVVSKHSEDLAVFGSVTEGAKRLGAVNKLVRQDLMNMGMSIEQINDGLPDMFKLMGQGAATGLISDKELGESAKGLMTEMDAMARLTGKSRQSQVDALKKQQSNAAFQQMLASMDVTKRAQVNETMARMNAQFGELGGEAVKLQLMGMAPATKEMQLFYSTTPGAVAAIGQLTDQVKNTNMSQQQFAKTLDDTSVTAVKSALQSGKGLTDVLKAAAAGVGGTAGEVANNFEKLYAAQSKFTDKNGNLDEDAYRNELTRVREQQAKTDELNKSLGLFENTVRKAKEGIMDGFITPLMTKLQPTFSRISTSLGVIITNVSKKFEKFIDSPVMGELLKSFEDIPAKIEQFGTWLMDEGIPNFINFIRDTAIPVFWSLVDISKFVIDHFGAIVAVGGTLLALWVLYNGFIVASNLVIAFNTLGLTANTVATWAATAPMIALAAAAWATVSPFLALAAPVIAIIAALALLYYGIKSLVANGWNLSNSWSAIKDNVENVFLSLMDVVLSVVETFGKFVGMDTTWIHEKRKGIAAEKGVIKDRERERDAEREQNKTKLKTEQDELDSLSAGKSKLAKQDKDQIGLNDEKLRQSKKLEDATKSKLGLGITTGAVSTAASGESVTPPINKDQKANIDKIRAELEMKGMNQKQIAAVLGNVGKETGFKSREEDLRGYANTDNSRIRNLFGTRVAGKSDAQLDAIKRDPEKMGETVYGSGTQVGKDMGNTQPGDGFKYRGRGYIQITGKGNYANASKSIYGDDRLVKNPDLATNPDVAAQITAWYSDVRGKSMAKQMKVDLTSGSQEDINRVYTSAVAGREIKKGEGGFLGGEALGKVNSYASQFTGTQVAAPAAGAVMAQNTPAAPAAPESKSTPAAQSPSDIMSAKLIELVDIQWRALKQLNEIAHSV